MQHVPREAEILIVGAGMAGLAAASNLQRAGHNVLVTEKGRGVGGRLASRRIGRATFDHGAQFMTSTDSRFAAAIEEWLHAGVIEEWYRNTSDGAKNSSYWRGKPTMTAMAKQLAYNLKVLLEKRIVTLRRNQSSWTAELDEAIR